MGFLAVIAVVQFLYCVLGGNFVSFPLLFLSNLAFYVFYVLLAWFGCVSMDGLTYTPKLK